MFENVLNTPLYKIVHWKVGMKSTLTNFMPLISFDKTSEDPWFSDVFRGYQKRSVAWNGLMKLCLMYHEYVNVTDSLFHNQLSLTWWWGALWSFLKKITQIKKTVLNTHHLTKVIYVPDLGTTCV